MNISYVSSFTFFIALACASASCVAFAEKGGDVRVGRYTTVAPIATTSQSDLLSVVINVTFDSPITTVGEALAHLLVRSGYQLADLDASDPYLPILLSRPLPQAHRQLGPIRLDSALTTLAGPAWRMVVDPVNRLISYELINQYRPISFTAASDRPFDLIGQPSSQRDSDVNDAGIK